MKRVISLTPACTEIICALNCASQLAGCSQDCDFPPEIRALPVFDPKKVQELPPDLIFAANPMPDLNSRVVQLAPRRFSDLWTNIQLVADELDVSEQGRKLISELKNRLVDVIAKTCTIKSKPTVVCIDCIEPLRVAGFWIPDLVEFAGGQNLLSELGKPSVIVDWSALAKANPEVIVFMPDGFKMENTRRALAPLEQKPEWHKIEAVKRKKVFIADSAQYFSRPGPRLMDSQEILAEILHPNLFRLGGEGKTWQRV